MTAIDELARDFRSDTVTLPTPEMKRFMMDAELGDDVFSEDPTVQALQARAASLTGMAAALYFPTGSMANLTALLSHTSPGRILYSGANSHIKVYEMGSYARIAGLSLEPVDDARGWLDLDHLARALPPDIYYMPRPGLVAVENTHNMNGGLIYPVERLAELGSFVRGRGLPIHMDGARLLNAARAANRPVTDWTAHVDSVSISMNKGLGAPMGSLLAGSQALIGEALRFRKLLGGGMRQSGVVAAAGLFALDRHLPLLDRDHRRCRTLYDRLKDLPFLEAIEPQTNILIFELNEPRAGALAEWLARRGLRTIPISDAKIRVVFHFQIAEEACEELAEAIAAWGDVR